MATAFKSPGVYIQEISTLPASIAPVATAIPAFVGYTEKAEEDGESLVDKPTRITSLQEYEELFGGPDKEMNITVTVDDTGATRVITAQNATPSPHIMHHAMRMYFANGGGPCYIVSVGDEVTGDDNYPGAVTKAPLSEGLAALKKVDEPTLIVIPEAVEGLTTPSDYGALMGEALTQCNDLQDRFTIMDVLDNEDPDQDAIDFRDLSLPLSFLRYGAAYYPNIMSVINYAYDDVDVIVTHFPSSETGAVDYSGTLEDIKLGGTGGINANLELYNQILLEINKLRVELPPSSTMAGTYARVDRDRGVWKAPANVSILNATGPSQNITSVEQETLNVDATSGKSINAIRPFTGKGTLVWGARTLAGNDNEWRYVPVRRLFIFTEESIQKATEFVVFEPNDANTWLRVKTMIENFLTELWKDGALAGAVASDAFFVNVGLGQTMTAQDILEGRLIIDVGMAAVRPAEFIVLRFSHKLQQS